MWVMDDETLEALTQQFLTALRNDPEELIALAQHASRTVKGEEWVEEQLVIKIRRLAQVTSDSTRIGALVGIPAQAVTRICKKHGIRLVKDSHWFSGVPQ